MVPCYPVCWLLPAFTNRFFLTTVARPPSHSLGAPPTAVTWRFLLASAPSLCHLTMNRSGALRTPWYHLPAYFAATVHIAVSTPAPTGSVPWTPPCLETPVRASNRHQCQAFGCPSGLWPSSLVIVTSFPRLGNRPLLCHAHAPRKEEPPFMDGRFDVLTSCLLERLRVREGVVGTLSALKANNPWEDLVNRLKLGEMFRTESTYHTRTTGSQSPPPSTCRLSD